MRSFFYKIRNKLLISIIPIIIISLATIIFLGTRYVEVIFVREHENIRKVTGDYLKNSVILIDRGFKMLEKSIEADMESSILAFQEEFARAGNNPDSISLEEIKEKLDNKYDLILIDKETTIIKTTISEGENFNFRKFDSKLGDVIDSIRIADDIKHERIRTNVGTGDLSKFTYVSSTNNEYVLELVYSEGGLSTIVAEMDPVKITNNIAFNNTTVTSVRIFDIFGYEFSHNKESFKPTQESLWIVEKAKAENNFEIKEKNLVKTYQMIDLNDKEYSMTDNSKVIEITYDNSKVLEQIKAMTLLLLILGGLAISAIILLVYYVSGRIMAPIAKLSLAAKKITEGDYNVSLELSGDDEVAELSQVMQDMMVKITTNIKEIEKQKNELENYNINLEKMVESRTKALAISLEDSNEMQRLLLKNNLQFDRLFNNMQEGFVIYEVVYDTIEDKKIIKAYIGLDANKAFSRLTGIGSFEIKGQNLKEESDWLESKWIEQLEEVIRDGKSINFENHFKRIGKYFSVNVFSPEENKIAMIFSDISAQKEKQEKIEFLNYHDQLTGLYNRRFFEEEIKRVNDENLLPISIAMLDVNGLKLINDVFGHKMGDYALKRISEVIISECKSVCKASRYGGDEFIIIMPRTDEKEAKSFIEKLVQKMEHEKIDSIVLSVSAGVACKTESEDEIEDIFKKAEDQMYRNKLSESKSMHYKTVDAISNTLYSKSSYEKKHAENVSVIAEMIAQELSLSKNEIKEIKTSGLMHDIGKIAIDLKILEKNSQLSKEEWKEIRKHPETGYQILRSINEFGKIADYTLSHHERWDGKGYPRGLKHTEIPLQARIIAIADAFDAMVQDRVFRDGISKEKALEEIKNNSGTQFDPELVKLFEEKIIPMIDKLL